MSNIPRCSFQVRVPTEGQPGKFRYDPIRLKNQRGISLETPHPPLLGDLVFLEGAVYEVIGRMWKYPDHGSRDWPWDDYEPRWGPLLDIIVIPAAGLYADEAETEEDAGERTLSKPPHTCVVWSAARERPSRWQSS